MGAYRGFPKRSGKHLPPLRSTAELADEFGVKNAVTLGGIMAQSPVPPPNAKSIHHKSRTVHYYDPREMREWWQKHLDATRGKT